jgi:HEPN domain-containing protein
MPSREDALILYHKADEDVRLASLLTDKPEFSDEAFGFHLQQAVEKLLKSLLAAREISFPFSHNLYDVVDLCRERVSPRNFNTGFEEIVRVIREA